LKEDIKMEIESKNAGIKVYMDKECLRNIDGDNVKNIVNYLSTNALQIEQSKEVRDKSKLRLIVANAVVKVIGPKITV
jgi:selenophosphate synthetase-related protein